MPRGIPKNLISCCAKCHGKTMVKREYWNDVLSQKIMEKYSNSSYKEVLA